MPRESKRAKLEGEDIKLIKGKGKSINGPKTQRKTIQGIVKVSP